MKRWLLSAVGLAISLTILVYLFRQAYRNEQFTLLWEAPKQWGLLVVGLIAAFSAIGVTFARWFLLVRALGIPFRMRDAFRLGFIGYFLNFFTVGVVGGDAVKAVFLARQRPKQRTEAVASVVIDRVIGLFALFLLTTLASWGLGSGSDASGLMGGAAVSPSAEQRAVQIVIRVAAVSTAAGCLALLALQFAQRLTPVLQLTLFRLPLVSDLFRRLHLAALAYRNRPATVFTSIGLSLLVHFLNVIAVFLIAEGLPGTHPDFRTHLVIVPLSMVAGALPLPGGMGSFEWALDFLYASVSSTAQPLENGLLVAFGYRLITLLIAAVGIVFYFASQSEIRRLVREAQQGAEVSDVGEPGAVTQESDAVPVSPSSD